MTAKHIIDMTGKVVLITGGSRGLGRDMALGFAAAGADLIIASRKLVNCESVAAEIEALGRDPLATSELPSTPYARAVAEEFVTMNLNEQDSRELAADVAHRLRAIVVFVSEETAFVATSRVTVEKLIALMKALERPVQPHLVDDALIARLLDQVYGATPPDDVKL